jgi:hypothetical protein
MSVKAMGVFFVARVAVTCTPCNSTESNESTSFSAFILAALTNAAKPKTSLFILLTCTFN